VGKYLRTGISTGLICLLLLCVVGSRSEAGKKYEFVGTFEQESGVVVAIHGGVCKYALWPSVWSKVQKMAAEHGGMRLYTYMLDTGDDWLGLHLFVPAGDTLVIGPSTRIELRLEDKYGNVDSLLSEEIVLTDSPAQRFVYSNVDQLLMLTDGVRTYHKAQNGAWVAFARFERGQLKLDHDKGIEAAGIPTPLACTILSETRR
jgi:hypothetical protein